MMVTRSDAPPARQVAPDVADKDSDEWRPPDIAVIIRGDLRPVRIRVYDNP
jgi:hypothetical protein